MYDYTITGDSYIFYGSITVIYCLLIISGCAGGFISDVRSQENIKRVLEVAAAGGCDVIMLWIVYLILRVGY